MVYFGVSLVCSDVVGEGVDVVGAGVVVVGVTGFAVFVCTLLPSSSSIDQLKMINQIITKSS